MNIFLPCENDIKKSVQSLDDLRLNKQILECYQLLSSALREENGELVSAYYHHPVYLFYKNNTYFLTCYGISCCQEFEFRFGKVHKLYNNYLDIINSKFDKQQELKYTPYYMEGSANSDECIRTTFFTSLLFQSKLIQKWENDKKKPKWTNTKIPDFYNEYLKLKNKQEFWNTVQIIKNKEIKFTKWLLKTQEQEKDVSTLRCIFENFDKGDLC